MSRYGMISLLLSISLVLCPIYASRSIPESPKMINGYSEYIKAPNYQNENRCRLKVPDSSSLGTCNPSLIHVSMTLDSVYLRGSMAAVNSILRHISCPQNVYFHFIASSSDPTNELNQILRATFPSLAFTVYPFAEEKKVKSLISSSIRQALDNPLNYARTYLADIIPSCVKRVIYLDSDIILVDDILKLWSIKVSDSKAIGAPEYCHANFTKYFTNEFWSNPEFSQVFQGKKPCYFNTGVMVIELERWRKGDFTRKIEKWMEIQKEKLRIYQLGSLPPFLLVFGGDIEPIHHRWNQHGLGGDNLVNSCRSLHSGPVSLLHWSGKGKPWVRLDKGIMCPVDFLWAPYDLHTNRFLHSPQR